MKQEGQQTILSRFCSKILLIPIIFLLANCATTSQIIDSGVIRIGMSKNELRDVLYQTYPSEDPFIPSGISEMFYKEKKEIIYGSANTVFYVFRNVTKPIRYTLVIWGINKGFIFQPPII